MGGGGSVGDDRGGGSSVVDERGGGLRRGLEGWGIYCGG